MADLTDIVLPHAQLEGTTHQVGRWLKQVGDQVRKDEPLLELITDKVTVELASDWDGVLHEILKQDGEEVQKGDVLGRIESGGGVREAGGGTRTAEFQAPRSGPATPQRSGELELSPAVRRLIQEKGLDPATITGSGRGGRITLQDVEVAAREAGGGARAAGGPSRRVPHSPVRKSIAEHMVRSMATAPHVTALFEVDLSRVAADRKQQSGVTYTAYFIRAAVAALQAVPEVNSRWHADALELFEDCNIGVAVALEQGGLIVPVLQRAQELDLAATARRLNDLTERARAGKLEPRDVQGGTFTLSNHGVSGSLLAAPIVINQPQSAILGVGKVEQRPRVARSGSIEARPMAYVTLTIDHRVLDGYQANRFLGKWVEVLEAWQ